MNRSRRETRCKCGKKSNAEMQAEMSGCEALKRTGGLSG